MQIFQTSSDISTPDKLAAVISDSRIAKYKDIPQSIRQEWMAMQIYALCFILHYQAPSPVDVKVDTAFADQMIMDDTGLRSLTQVEMQEAFRRGIAREYGDFFGITATSLIGFLKGFVKSEKRQEAISIIYTAEQKRIALEKEKENKLMYELQAHNITLPFWGSKRNKREVTKEESLKHREMVARQRDEILKNNAL